MFLGTSGDPIAVSKQLRKSHGILLRLGETTFFLDPGPGSMADAISKGLNLRELSAIVLSHRHLNHAGDANAAISAMTLGGLDKRGVLIASKELIEGSEDKPPVIDPFFKKAVERILFIEDKKKVGVGNVDIVAEKLIHDDETFGFKFFSHSICFGYMSDTEYFSGLIEKFKGTDVLIINLQNPFNVSSSYHLNAEDAVKLINNIKPSLTILTHFGSKMLNADPIIVTREIRRKVEGEVIMAKDGLVIEPRTYALGSVQKRLKY